MKRIETTFIIGNLGQGGAERQFLELIKNINKSKFDVSVCLFAINRGVFYTEIETVENIQLIKNTLKNRNKIFKIIEALIFIFTYLKNNNFDIVFTSLFMNGLFVRVMSPNKYKSKIISSIRTSLTQYDKIHLFVEKYLLKKSFVITNSKIACENFKLIVNKKYHFRISYIYNGYDTLLFSNEHKEINRNVILLGNVGRMTYLKNQIQILKAFSMLNNENLRIQIIGANGDQTALLSNFKNSIQYSGHIELIDKVSNIQDYYKKFDVFILSSFLEGCPNSLFEAMLSKCLCIISVKCNSDSFIENGINGFVYDGTDDGLKITLLNAFNILNTPEELRIIENGYKYAQENFSMNSMVNNYENLFMKIYEENESRH
jgi:glycosyltransferase involved in cell wall biosynthesis